MSDSNCWPLDRREIVAAMLPDHPHGIMLSADGFTFERLERNGEMAPLPYLRVRRGVVAIEAPLPHFAWVEFAEDAS